MLPETRELLAALRKVNQEIPALALGLMDGSVSVAKQLAFAEVLEGAGAALRVHAQEQRPVVIGGDTDAELNANAGKNTNDNANIELFSANTDRNIAPPPDES